MNNLLLQIKQSIKFFIKYKILIIPFILTILVSMLFYLSPSLLSFFTYLIDDNNNVIHLRNLQNNINETNSTNENEIDDALFDNVNFTLIEGMNTNLTDILLYYEFIDSISHTYYGDWDNLYLKKK